MFANIPAGSVRPFWASNPNAPLTGLMKPPLAVDRDHNYVSFIGIDWGHLEDLTPGAPTTMATVIPDYKLIELLDSDELMEQRKQFEASDSAKHPKVVVDSTPPEPELTKSDLESGPKTVSRTIDPEK